MGPIKTIYLVDDDQDDRFFIKEAIQGADISLQIVEVENGLDLLDLIQKQEAPIASLILLDMNMPKMNGLETVSAIRSYPALSAIPVIMISTSSNATLIATAYKAGVSGFLTKPSTFEEFNLLAREIVVNFLD
ncbi:MAG: response regulator [Dyadobacter sp.]|uniref:response regulator n=1 Tax=Dyadobacter sp. TaxID=1914288 RepID=UPI0032661753